MAIALFIGRFQPFHKGHLWAIKEILKKHEKIIIGIGSSQFKRTFINPFSLKERKEMIIESLKAENINDYVLFDIPDIEQDEEWVGHVNKIIPNFEIVYTGSLLSRRLFLEKGYKVENLERFNNINGSDIRLRIHKGLPWEHKVPGPVIKILRHINAKEKIKISP